VRPKQREFARRNLSHTVVSKRKLLQLVSEKYVSGWDDPRMSTISGLRRRGYTPASLRNFANTIGIAKRDNLIDVSMLEFCIREDLNKTAPRVMAVIDPVKLVITNYPEGKTEWLEAENNPEDESAGFRKIPFSRELYIEREDFMEDAPSKFFRLSIGKEVRLKNAYIIKGENVVKDASGNITEIRATYDTDSLSGSGTEASARKVSGTLHWVSALHAILAEIRLYDRLFTDEAPDSHKEKDFLEFVNPDSLKVVDGYLEPGLASAKAEDKFQFQRLGYFTVDKDSTINKLVFNRTVSLKDAWAEQDQNDKKVFEKIEREISGYFKQDYEARSQMRAKFREAIGGIRNYSLLKNEFQKSGKNDKNMLLLKNFILRFSRLGSADFDWETMEKFYHLSLRSESTYVRTQAYLNLADETNEVAGNFEAQLKNLLENPPKDFTIGESQHLKSVLLKLN
jgi:glutaminyl-tRNA synthetase